MRDFLVGVVAFIGLFVACLIAFPALLIAAYCVAVPVLYLGLLTANVLGKWIVLGLMVVVSLLLLCVFK